ncbi:hypothetical protein VTN77DRAFT_8341 [Rasamsonia byssochlamydoides]|uniref:uncharacterized protein n=1 Tax=Rasamsonia byssochlamydoides TaxID=89139 RepID=UPI0037436D5B
MDADADDNNDFFFQGLGPDFEKIHMHGLSAGDSSQMYDYDYGIGMEWPSSSLHDHQAQAQAQALDWNWNNEQQHPEAEGSASTGDFFSLSDMIDLDQICCADDQPGDINALSSALLSRAETGNALQNATSSPAAVSSAREAELRGQDFANVPQWLDGAYRPPVPCTYCRQRRLQCLIIRTTPVNPNPVTSCSSCAALFRECSLARGEKRQPSDFETVTPVYGHLHGVTERVEEMGSDPVHAVQEENRNSCEAVHGGSQTAAMNDGPSDNSRPFSRKGARVLRNWFHQHQDFPYPTDEEKKALAQEAGLTKRQVSNWFANARRRQKQQQNALNSSSVSNQFFPSGSPMPTTDGFALMTPMERWKRSPPESEPVSEAVIRDAIASARNLDEAGFGTANRSFDDNMNDGDDFFPVLDDAASSHFTSSVSSLGTRYSEESSDSVSSAWSYQSGDRNWPFPLLSGKQSNILGKRRRRRRRRPVEEHRYQCTFCLDSFKKKHDWCRHEKSVHLSLQEWICTPSLEVMLQIGQTSQDESQEESHQAESHQEGSQKEKKQHPCNFCGYPSPSPTHWATHDFEICADRPLSERTFRRKDHLWQHLQKFHRCRSSNNNSNNSGNSNGMPPDIAASLEAVCRIERNDVRSRCGFCGLALHTWSQRADHLAEHFKEGRRMSQWIGDWGLDGSVLRELRDAVLPEERSPWAGG